MSHSRDSKNFVNCKDCVHFDNESLDNHPCDNCHGGINFELNIRPQGIWTHSSDHPDTLICSICDFGFDMWKYEPSDLKFCPHCGSKMIGDGSFKSKVEYLMKDLGITSERAIEIINIISSYPLT